MPQAVIAGKIGQVGAATAMFTFTGLLLLFFAGGVGINGKSCGLTAASSGTVLQLARTKGYRPACQAVANVQIRCPADWAVSRENDQTG